MLTFTKKINDPRTELILTSVATGVRPAHLIMPSAIKTTFEFVEERAIEVGLMTQRYGDALLVFNNNIKIPLVGDWKKISSDVWTEVLGYPCKLRKCQYSTTVYYDIETKHMGRIHLYWYRICADTQEEFDRLRLSAINDVSRMKKALIKGKYNIKKSKNKSVYSYIKIYVTFLE